jgi:hypothetical protein
LRIKECSSNKFTSCRTGSTRNEKICTYSNKPSSMSVRHTRLAGELAKGLTTSIVASMRTGWLTPWFSLEPARTSSPPPCSSATCPSRQTPTPVGLDIKSDNSSRPLPCSRPRALPRGDASNPRSGSLSPPDKRERPRFIPSLPDETGWRLSPSTLPTIPSPETPVATSLSAARVNTVIVWLEVTTYTEAGATTAQKIEALHPSLRALGSSVRLSTRRYSRLSFALP